MVNLNSVLGHRNKVTYSLTRQIIKTNTKETRKNTISFRAKLRTTSVSPDIDKLVKSLIFTTASSTRRVYSAINAPVSNRVVT